MVLESRILDCALLVIFGSPAYAGSHGCESMEECERVFPEALAKEQVSSDPLGKKDPFRPHLARHGRFSGPLGFACLATSSV